MTIEAISKVGQMNTQTIKRIRQVYVGWKLWSPDIVQDHQYSVYEEEMLRAGLAPAARILEVGFGEGSFLDWAQKHGFTVFGLELDPQLVAAARARGHTVQEGEVRDAFGSYATKFDAVVLFDVLEHITIDGILALFDQLQLLLAPGGKIIARFPNGASPFGRAYQYGDATHVSVLTCSSISQIALAAGLRLVGQYNAARGTTSRSGGFRNSRLLRGAAFLLRDLIQAVLSRVYFGKDLPMDPNVTVILQKCTNDGEATVESITVE